MEQAAQRAHAVFNQCRGLLGQPSVPDPSGIAPNIWELQQHLRNAVTDAESICTQLSSGQAPDSATTARAVASSAGAIARLGYHAHQQHCQITTLQQRCSNLEGDQGKLLLQQMATQAINKLARKIEPALSAYDARDHSMSIVAHMAKSKGNDSYTQYIEKYNGLKAGVKTLCDLGRPVAHPIPEPPVTEDDLRAAITKNIAPGMRAYAMDVLACLLDLAADLKEPLFVSTENSSS